MIKCKVGVKLFGLRPEMLVVLQVADAAWQAFGHDGPTITSARDSVHGFGSLHCVGAAVDLRSKDLPDDHKRLILTRLRDCLTDEFDILLEAEGQANEHFHIEFQPKTT